MLYLVFSAVICLCTCRATLLWDFLNLCSLWGSLLYLLSICSTFQWSVSKQSMLWCRWSCVNAVLEWLCSYRISSWVTRIYFIVSLYPQTYSQVTSNVDWTSSLHTAGAFSFHFLTFFFYPLFSVSAQDSLLLKTVTISLKGAWSIPTLLSLR